MDNSDNSNKNFFKHVFNFDNDAKSEILNILQYSLIAIIPVVILSKTIGKYVPEAEDKKGSLEISAEIILQVVVTFMGLLIIHRIITFIPTYSGEKYPDFHIIYIILAILLITMSLQTKIGEKVTILVERILELWNGKSDKSKNKKNNTKVSNQLQAPMPGQITGQAMLNPQSSFSDGTAINSLPTNEVKYGNSNTIQPEKLPDYNTMFRKDNNPLIDAASPQESFGPVAASEFLGGGSSLGSAW